MPFKLLSGFKAKPLGQFTTTELDKVRVFAGEDAGPMLVFKQTDALALLRRAADDLKKGRCLKPMVKPGRDNGDLVLLIEDIGGYEESSVLIKGYDKAKKAHATATVVAAQPDDPVVKQSAGTMAAAKGTKVRTADEADLNEKGSTAPIVIMAHGSKTGNSPGQVYGSDFADSSAAQIVSYIAGTKKLAKNYAGVIYLDGCYTAAGPQRGTTQGELNNFCASVYDGLVRKGYDYLQVKGNLGLAAATFRDGGMNVLDAQEEARMKMRQNDLLDQLDGLNDKADRIKAKLATLKRASAALVKKYPDDEAAMRADPAHKVIAVEVAKLDEQRAAAKTLLRSVAAEIEEIGADRQVHGAARIRDLVGVFGPEKLVSEPWYKTLFA